MDYGRYYEELILKKPGFIGKFITRLLTNKAKKIGQKSHKIWTLKYLIDNYVKGNNLVVVDIGTHGGFNLSYNSRRIKEKIGIERDEYFAKELKRKGIKFYKVDVDKQKIPLKRESVDLVMICSMLEHTANVDFIVRNIHKILKKDGIVYIVVPDVKKVKFNFWNDITHKTPFTKESLRFLLEANGFETLRLEHYNHNFFILGFLFSSSIHEFISKINGKYMRYIGRKR